MLVGTPAFLPPEALEEKEIDERSDLFSLGVTFYRAVTGKLPFEGLTPFATMQRVAKTEFTPLHELVPDISAELRDIINSLLQRDPDQRIQSADELVRRLKSARPEAAERSDQGLPIITVASSSQIAGDVAAKHSQADTRRPLIALASLVVCSLLVYVAFFRDGPSIKEQGIEVAQNDSSAHSANPSGSPSVPEAVLSDSERARNAEKDSVLIADVNSDDVGDRVLKGLEIELPDGGVREATLPVTTADSAVRAAAATKTLPASTSTPEPVDVKPKPYVVIAEDDKSRSEFDSLRDAILAATSGSTVEIQESGRHTIRRPISLHSIALTIAAKQGVLPTIVTDLENSEEPLIRTDSDLSLRGLIVAAEGDELDEDGSKAGALVHVREAMLKCSECRFTAREASPIAVLENCRSATWIDCELYSPLSVAIHWQPSPDGYLVVEQCVVVSRIFVSSPRLPHSASVILTANAIANEFTFKNRDEVIEQSKLSRNKPPRMRMTVERNLILCNDSLINIEADKAIPVTELAVGFQWQGNRNTLPTTFLTQSETDDEDDEESNLEIDGMSEWIKLPSVSDVGSTTAESLESLVTESDYDVLFDTPQAFSRIVGTLIKARRLPVADSSIEQTLLNAGPDK